MIVTITSPRQERGVIVTKGTTVVMEDGTKISDICGLTVHYPLDGVVTATLDVHVNPQTIRANAMLSLDSVRQAAKYYGFELQPADVTSFSDESKQYQSRSVPPPETETAMRGKGL
jgi:hypothetical protein